MNRRHQYETTTVWNGDRGRGTADYRAYDRLYDTSAPGRPSASRQRPWPSKA